MADQPRRTQRLDERFSGKYLSLTSYKRDGTGIATPVWFVIDDGRLLVMTMLVARSSGLSDGALGCSSCSEAATSR